MNQKTLDEILEYKNNNVVNSFLKQYPIERCDAEMIFKNVLKWLWYCRTPESQGYRTIDMSIFAIDEMWHNFILHTPDYMKFCNEYFGGYVHHQPSTEDDKVIEKTHEELISERKMQYEIVYEKLGRETFIEWYHTIPEKFSAEQLNESKFLPV